MADVTFTDVNTLSLGVYYYPSRAICPIHGEVTGDFSCFATSDPLYWTGKICPKCFIDWIARNVTSVTPVNEVRPAHEDATP